MSGRRWLGIVLILLAGLFVPHPSLAQEPATVYGLFFYSPTCPHCHEVIEDHWPAIQAEFGDQLKVLFVDASTPQGGAIMAQMRSAMQIEAQGVPMLIIGSEVLVGSVQIPERAPAIVREGLAQGGIPIPAVPGIEEIFREALAQAEASGTGQRPAGPAQPADATALPASGPAAESDGAPLPNEIVTDAGAVNRASLADRFAADPVANSLASLLLLLLAGSALIAPALLQPQRRPTAPAASQAMLRLLALIGTLVGLALLLGSRHEPLVFLLAVGLLAAFAVLLICSLRDAPALAGREWAIPLVLLAGLAVSGYLASVELSHSEAVCGAVGNCNVVQQSGYAQIYGVPIGVIGIVGYLGMLALWLLSRRVESGDRARKLLLGVAFVGVLFSTYLTFLEPFVIGATCLWCLTSAALMLMLLWLLLPESTTPPPPRARRRRMTAA